MEVLPSAVSFAEFLESGRPGTWARVSDDCRLIGTEKDERCELFLPEINLHCEEGGLCGGTRVFKPIVWKPLHGSQPHDVVYVRQSLEPMSLRYLCRNCGKSTKHFFVLSQLEESRVRLYKAGEYPPFGPPVPTRASKLIGPDRDLFFRGRRCENQGLGVGAFAYYRRVVENQWRRLHEQILLVAQVTGSSAETIQALEDASKEGQFSKAVKEVGVPESLKIQTHNPLTLLHSALSDGLHDRSDEECLMAAADAREVLYALAERVEQALQEDRGLKDAVARLGAAAAARAKKSP